MVCEEKRASQNYTHSEIKTTVNISLTQLLVSMSEAARSNQIYVVLNTRELMDCVANNSNENCPESKEYVFNTNVVFDRTGAVIDRYVFHLSNAQASATIDPSKRHYRATYKL